MSEFTNIEWVGKDFRAEEYALSNVLYGRWMDRAVPFYNDLAKAFSFEDGGDVDMTEALSVIREWRSLLTEEFGEEIVEPAKSVLLATYAKGIVESAEETIKWTEKQETPDELLELLLRVPGDRSSEFIAYDVAFYGSRYYDRFAGPKINNLMGWMQENRGAIPESALRDAETVLKKVTLGSNYWENLSGVAANRAYNFGIIDLAVEQAVEDYQLVNPMDVLTTEVCEYLHGKKFKVADAVSAMNAYLATPPGTPGVEFPTIEQIKGLSAEEIAGNQWGSPPYHGNCRTIIVLIGRTIMSRTIPADLEEELLSPNIAEDVLAKTKGGYSSLFVAFEREMESRFGVSVKGLNREHICQDLFQKFEKDRFNELSLLQKRAVEKEAVGRITRLAHAIDNLAPQVKEGMRRGVKSIGSFSGLDYAELGGYADSYDKMAAFFDYSDSHIGIHPLTLKKASQKGRFGTRGTWLEETLTHEVGHGVNDTIRRAGGDLAAKKTRWYGEAWTDVSANWRSGVKKPDYRFVSGYAGRAPTEDWAESYAMRYTDPETALAFWRSGNRTERGTLFGEILAEFVLEGE